MDINLNTYNPYSTGNGYFRAHSTDSTRSGPTAAPTLSDPSESDPSASGPSPSDPETRFAENSDPTKAQGSNSNQGQETSEEQPFGSEKALSQAELQLVTELKQVDTEVRNHELAHIAAGGSLITSGASFTYQRGPDGNNYAVAGEVGIDTSAIPGDPRATVEKMQRVKRSALAPANPSGQDRKVASQAAAMAAKASSELTMLMAKEQAAANETKAFGNQKQASDSYIKVNTLPEKPTNTFDLAV